ncbi:hypothetical protein EV426DRAFT_360831 [Tirmania nivea]|nr:hypothetical protein EV426DRAFT_360831 [Tirmania nivea]
MVVCGAPPLVETKWILDSQLSPDRPRIRVACSTCGVSVLFILGTSTREGTSEFANHASRTPTDIDPSVPKVRMTYACNSVDKLVVAPRSQPVTAKIVCGARNSEGVIYIMGLPTPLSIAIQASIQLPSLAHHSHLHIKMQSKTLVLLVATFMALAAPGECKPQPTTKPRNLMCDGKLYCCSKGLQGNVAYYCGSGPIAKGSVTVVYPMTFEVEDPPATKSLREGQKREY